MFDRVAFRRTGGAYGARARFCARLHPIYRGTHYSTFIASMTSSGLMRPRHRLLHPLEEGL